MWVWISIVLVVVVCSVVFAVAAVRSWRQVQGLRAQLTAVRTQVDGLTAGLEVTVPAERHN